jgi:hypothetical protein
MFVNRREAHALSRTIRGALNGMGLVAHTRLRIAFGSTPRLRSALAGGATPFAANPLSAGQLPAGLAFPAISEGAANRSTRAAGGLPTSAQAKR